ncbi:MAG: hypothetical protein FWF87_07800 [Synergistaceae bacterium]|nr:hypothetical protein [Synergistaceae bacterium]
MSIKKIIKKTLFLVMLSLVFTFICSAVNANEIKAIWNHISLNYTEYSSVNSKAKDIWEKFENSSIQRGLVVKHNYRPFVPVVNRIIILDTPAGELAYRSYYLRIETEVIDGKDSHIAEIALIKLSDKQFPEATMEQQFGYKDGKLGEKITYWVSQKSIIPGKLSASDQLKTESFKRSIEPEFIGDIDNRRVPKSDIFHFFPEISNDLKLNFEYLYPQNDKPMMKTTFTPGRIHFGSLLDTDVKISFIHNIATLKMVNGEIIWKTKLSSFTTGEEMALSDSFFNFMQESLAKEEHIAPASPVLY